MENMGMGAGLGALGFWLFVGIAVFAGFWDAARKREAKHETLRRIIESDKPIDPELVDKLLSATEKGSTGSIQDLVASMKLTGVLLLFLAPGLPVLGWFVGAFLPLLGVSALLLFLAGGFFVTAKLIPGWYGENGSSASN